MTISGDARYRLSEIFVEATRRREPDVEAAYLAKQREKSLRSPLIVVVIAKLIESEKIPEIERALPAGAAAHNILLAANCSVSVRSGSPVPTPTTITCAVNSASPTTSTSSVSFISARRHSKFRRGRRPTSTSSSAAGSNPDYRHPRAP